MKIILSPAKKMIVDTDNLAPVELPVFIDKTAEVLNWMKSKSKEELKAIWIIFYTFSYQFQEKIVTIISLLFFIIYF